MEFRVWTDEQAVAWPFDQASRVLGAPLTHAAGTVGDRFVLEFAQGNRWHLRGFRLFSKYASYSKNLCSPRIPQAPLVLRPVQSLRPSWYSEAFITSTESSHDSHGHAREPAQSYLL